MSTNQKVALKEAITGIVSCALQPDSEIQRLAEERKKALEMTDDYAFILIEIIKDNDEALAEKHMAAVFLKNYLRDCYNGVETHRHLNLPKSKESLQKLTSSLLDLLSFDFAYIKTMICKSLSYLVFQGMWSLVDNKLMSMIQTDNEVLIDSAVMVLNELIDPFRFRAYRIPSHYFELLLNIFQKPEKISSHLRADMVAPMITILNSTMPIETLPDFASRLGSVLESFLNQPYDHQNDFYFKSAIISGICTCVRMNRDIETTNSIILPCLPAVGQLLTVCCNEYKQVVMDRRSLPYDADENENDPRNFHSLIINLNNLINELMNSHNYSTMLVDGLGDLLYFLFIFMSSNSDMELFCEDDEKTDVFPIRNEACETFMNIIVRLKRKKIFFQNLNNVFQRHINETNQEKSNSEIYFYRITESLMYGLGVMRDILPEKMICEYNKVFPHQYYLELWSSTLLRADNLMVSGRLLLLGSKYSSSLSPATLTLHIKTIIQYFINNVKYLFLPCTEALQNHLAAFNTLPVQNRNAITSLANDIALCLITIFNKQPYHPAPTLNALANLLKYHENTASLYIRSIQDLIINAIQIHFSNVVIMKEINLVVGSLVMHNSCKEVLHSTLIPYFIKLLHKDVPAELDENNDIEEKGLDFINTVVIYSNQPIPDLFVFESFYSACKIILDSDANDPNTIEAATNLITTMLFKLTPQISKLQDEKRMRLIEYVPKIIFALLDPFKTNWTSKMGKLCVISIMSLSHQMEPHLETILKYVLSTVQVCRSLEIFKALWLIFAYIFMCRPGNTLNFLLSIPGPDGRSALCYLLNRWKPEHVVFIGKFDRTIIAVALTQVIAHAIDDGTNRINEITVVLQNQLIKSCGGIEYLYFLLIQVLLEEYNLTRETEDEDDKRNTYSAYETSQSEEENILFSVHPFNVDIVSHVKTFLKNYTQYFLNVVRTILYNDEIEQLTQLGVMPDLSME